VAHHDLDLNQDSHGYKPMQCFTTELSRYAKVVLQGPYASELIGID